MREQMSKTIRRGIARLFPGRFPRFYSTLDHPIEVPVQVAAYRLALEKFISPADRVLDVGIGLGYGLRMMAEKAGSLSGIDVDSRAVEYARTELVGWKNIRDVQAYDGRNIPYDNATFDVVTCIDVIEHVPDYETTIREMVRVTKRLVLISTPNRRPENTRPNGKPKNIWHLREWSFEEFDQIIHRIPGVRSEWWFINGPYNGPLYAQRSISADTQALTPVLIRLQTGKSG